MPTQTDCLNDALGQIGASRITAIDDGSINANFCSTFYPALLDMILRLAHWNFASGRAVLAQDPVPPLFQFTFSYPLPSDFIKIRDYNGVAMSFVPSNLAYFIPPQVYAIEGHFLYTNDGEVKITYTKRVTDPNLWDPIFYQIVATWLSSKLASAIPKDHTLAAKKLQEVAGMLLPFGVSIDGQEGSIIRYDVPDLTWGR